VGGSAPAGFPWAVSLRDRRRFCPQIFEGKHLYYWSQQSSSPELTPAGVELYVALGWPDDEKRNGYRDAKKKVADRVPAQDWGFVGLGEPKGFPQKSEETPNQGGRPKQEVAISANGMKHLLAHVPNQELANAWLQHLIDAEHQLRLTREAHSRESLCDTHKKAHQAVIENHGRQTLTWAGELEVRTNCPNLWMRLFKPTPELAWVFLPAQDTDHVDHTGLACGGDPNVVISAAVGPGPGWPGSTGPGQREARRGGWG
jgi:hypothetical protein